MKFLDDLPKRHSTHDTAEAAEIAFAAAIEAYNFFLVQQKDRNDYGTDLQIEVRHGDVVTNLRAHVQLKGTRAAANADGSVSVEVARANLNYLLAQPDSIYVCYHLLAQRLLVRYANDVFREYEHRGTDWSQQDKVTVRLTQAFDEEFQRCLHARVLASGKYARDRRLKWTATPPERIPVMVRQAIPAIEVPADPRQAMDILSRLYESGHDAVISDSFEQFAAVLGTSPGFMDKAYMAEINLGVNDLEFNRDRVREGMQKLQDAVERGEFHPGSLLYCQGNGWLALGEYEKAREAYLAALLQLEGPGLKHLAAQCSKNMGSALAALGKVDAARAFYERALELDPHLGEAHLALGLWHRRIGDDPRLALMHLDRVIRQRGSTLPISGVRGWRVEVLFKIGDVEGAFREIYSLLSEADQIEWAWPWCARQVATFGRASVDSAQHAARFWRFFIREHPGDDIAGRELLFCLSYLHLSEATVEIDFSRFKLMAIQLIDRGDSESALLWDRVGHWAQQDGDWVEAERAYRKAYGLEPERYGYCLGTALNFLDRYSEALPILIREAEEYNPDAMSWFQVAVARGGSGDVAGSIAAYQRALELDADYDLAWFNLGGMFWNCGDIAQAVITWNKAVMRFPDHTLAKKLQREWPGFFEVDHAEGD